jgi:hypothetical protein
VIRDKVSAAVDASMEDLLASLPERGRRRSITALVPAEYIALYGRPGKQGSEEVDAVQGARGSSGTPAKPPATPTQGPGAPSTCTAERSTPSTSTAVATAAAGTPLREGGAPASTAGPGSSAKPSAAAGLTAPVSATGRPMPYWSRILRADREGLLDTVRNTWLQLDARDCQLQYVYDIYHRDVLRIKEYLFREARVVPEGYVVPWPRPRAPRAMRCRRTEMLTRARSRLPRCPPSSAVDWGAYRCSALLRTMRMRAVPQT